MLTSSSWLSSFINFIHVERQGISLSNLSSRELFWDQLKSPSWSNVRRSHPLCGFLFYSITIFKVFSTSDRLFVYQMCYCCRKLEILCILYVWEADFGRPWEAVWGRGALIGLEIYLSQSGEHGLSRPLTFVMWSVWANQRVRSSGLSDWFHG